MSFNLGSALGVNIDATYTATEFTNGEAGALLGQRVVANDGNTYVFVKASSSVAAFALSIINTEGFIVEATTALAGSSPTVFVVPQLAIASGSYGWAVERGALFSVLALTLCAANAKVFTTTTAGAIDDASTTLVQGLKLNSVVGGATAATPATAIAGMYANVQT
jgi:hypothetical protein